jgi:hypothetical protein
MSRYYTQWCSSYGKDLPESMDRFRNISHFSCPLCAAPLRVAPRHLGAIYAISIVVSYVITFLCGFRSWNLLIAGILGSVPADLAINVCVGPARPPRVTLRQPTEFPFRFPTRPARARR